MSQEQGKLASNPRSYSIGVDMLPGKLITGFKCRLFNYGAKVKINQYIFQQMRIE